MFKLFDRGKAASKPLASLLDYAVVLQQNDMLKNDIENYQLRISRFKATEQMLSESNKQLAITRVELNDEIIALKAIISNLRKQKVYAGQKFYDPNNHRLPTIYLCARWNEWYMIRNQNQVQPFIMHNSEFQDLYGHYVLMPKQNANIKNIK